MLPVTGWSLSVSSQILSECKSLRANLQIGNTNSRALELHAKLLSSSTKLPQFRVAAVDAPAQASSAAPQPNPHTVPQGCPTPRSSSGRVGKRACSRQEVVVKPYFCGQNLPPVIVQIKPFVVSQLSCLHFQRNQL